MRNRDLSTGDKENGATMNSQRGAAVVEFAFVLPLLLVILFGIIEFSFLLYDKAMLTNASREGARVGIVYIPNRADNVTALETNIEAAVRDYCEDLMISFDNASALAITPTWIDGGDTGSTLHDSGDTLRVEVTYDFRFLVFSNLLALFGGNLDEVFDLHAVTVMRLE
jgi:Flp pilus assembly protein TadG